MLFTITSNPSRTLYFLIPDSIQPSVYVSAPQQWQRVPQIRSLLSQIPSDASVSATTYLIPHLSSRREVIRLPGLELRNDAGAVISVDYIIADLWQLVKYRPAFREDRLRLESITNLLEDITARGLYGITGFNNGVVLLQKDVESDAIALDQWQKYLEEIVQQESATPS